MADSITNIYNASYETGKPTRDGESPFRYLELAGRHLGIRIEEIPAGGTSSEHHYHSAEEEHVLVLEGNATLHLGDDRVALTPGDHICFPAGEPLPHHIENTAQIPLKYLVLGERKSDDVVFYPERSVMLVKSDQGHAAYQYVVPPTANG